MTTKEKLIRLLENKEGEFLSGNVIAEELGITRAAVWKQIRQLENDGYRIEGVRNKGYRLAPLYDVISADSISKYLKETASVVTLEVHDTLGSTNTYLKEKADGLPDWHVVIAGNPAKIIKTNIDWNRAHPGIDLFYWQGENLVQENTGQIIQLYQD